jgi:hypothetical protein
MKIKPKKIRIPSRGRHGSPKPNSGRRPSGHVDATKYYSREVKAALKKGAHGGPRPNSGRPLKPDKADWRQVSCFLRRDTIERLQRSATPPEEQETGKLRQRFGGYLQWHLNQYPPVSWETWQAYLAADLANLWHNPDRPRPRLKKIRLGPAERAAAIELRTALGLPPRKRRAKRAKNRGTPQLAK